MIRNISSILSLMVVLLCSSILYSQEPNQKEKDFYRHNISLMTGYAWVPTAVDVQGNTETIVIPTIGFDYNYCFSPKFSVGVINDLELSRYLVIEPNGNALKREYKYIGAVVAIYEPLTGLSLYAGPGIEYDVNKTFALVKIGFEVFKSFEEGWAFGVGASVDLNEVYQTYSLGVIISKKLR